ncbi:MAG: WD40 repeat domain-containing protein [Pirellulales bacterium]
MSLSIFFKFCKSLARWLAIVILLLNIEAQSSPQLFAQPTPATDSVGDPMPPGARLRIGTLRFRHPGNVAELALSPDGKTVVTLGDQLIAWDTATGTERWRGALSDQRIDVPAASYGMRWLAFAAGSEKLYSPGAYDTFVVHDMATGRREVVPIKDELAFNVGEPLVFQKPNKAIDITRDGKLIAVGGAGGLKVCDGQGKLLHEIVTKPSGNQNDERNGDRLLFGGDYCLGRFSPDGKLLAVVTSDSPQEIQLIDAATGRMPRRISLTARAVRFAFSPDGKQISATERDNAIRLYDVETTKPVWSYVATLTNPYENYTSAIAFAPDGNTVAAGATDHRIYLIDVQTGRELAKLEGHVWYPWALAFTADSNTLYSSGWDGSIRRWDIAAKQQLPLPVGVRATEVVAASPDGRTLAYADEAGTIRLVSASTGAELNRLQLASTRYTQLMFSPDGKRLAGGGTLGDNVHVAVWNLPGVELVDRWDWAKGRDPHSHVEALSFTPDGKRLAAAMFRQGAAHVWDLTTSQQIAQLRHNNIYGLCFSPDGQRLATAGWDSIVRLWNASTGKLELELNVKTMDTSQAPVIAAGRRGRDTDLRMYAVCYAPVGDLMATLHMSGQVWIWNTQNMSVLSKIGLREGSSYGALSFSPDGLWLAVGGSGGLVSLLDPRSGDMVLEAGKHQDTVYTVGFGRDSRTMVSGGDDGVCYLWDLRPRDPLPKKDPSSLWQDLMGNNGRAAYLAMWALADSPEHAVPLIAEQLRAGSTAIEQDATSGRWRTAQRAVSLVAQIGTPEAARLLEQLGDQASNPELSRLAKAALGRITPRE